MPTLSRKSLLELLYSSIVSAIGNVVDFMVGTSGYHGQVRKSPSFLIGIDEAVPLMQAVRSRAVGEDKSCTSVALSNCVTRSVNNSMSAPALLACKARTMDRIRSMGQIAG